MEVNAWLARWGAAAPELIGSAIVALVMVGAAYGLGFRAKRRLSEAELEGFADAESARIDGALIAPDGRAAFARLSNGKLMIARVMGDDVSVRIAPAAALRLSLGQGRLYAGFADLGFPPLNIRLEQTPPWLAELANGQG